MEKEEEKEEEMKILKDKNGFTLIEIIVVLVILAILTAIAVPKLIDMSGNTENRMIDTAIAKLNTIEKMKWLEDKVASDYKGDDFLDINYDLGTNYIWVSRNATGGILSFKNRDYVLIRIPSNDDYWGVWRK
jgi:prepilin-type N-terminal cleavage/methylation domain-containing protein